MATSAPAKKRAPAKRTTATRGKLVMADPTPVEVRAADLERALSNALVFVGRDDEIPVIASVYIKVSGKTLTTYATDRYTMIREHIELEGKCRAATVLVDRHSAALLTVALRRFLRSFYHRERGTAVVTITVTGRGPADEPGAALGTLQVQIGTVTRVEIAGEVGNYPDCDKLIDKRQKGDRPSSFATALNPNYLARIARVRVPSSKRSTAWFFSQDKPIHAVRAIPQDDDLDVDTPRLIVLTMPVRTAGITDADKVVEKW